MKRISKAGRAPTRLHAASKLSQTNQGKFDKLDLSFDLGKKENESDAVAFGSVAKDEGSQPTGSTAAYSCPAHPKITAAQPGSCPVCGAELKLLS